MEEDSRALPDPVRGGRQRALQDSLPQRRGEVALGPLLSALVWHKCTLSEYLLKELKDSTSRS